MLLFQTIKIIVINNQYFYNKRTNNIKFYNTIIATTMTILKTFLILLVIFTIATPALVPINNIGCFCKPII